MWDRQNEEKHQCRRNVKSTLISGDELVQHENVSSNRIQQYLSNLRF